MWKWVASLLATVVLSAMGTLWVSAGRFESIAKTAAQTHAPWVAERGGVMQRISKLEDAFVDARINEARIDARLSRIEEMLRDLTSENN